MLRLNSRGGFFFLPPGAGGVASEGGGEGASTASSPAPLGPLAGALGVEKMRVGRFAEMAALRRRPSYTRGKGEGRVREGRVVEGEEELCGIRSWTFRYALFLYMSPLALKCLEIYYTII
jgi:hypothetical protein